MLTCSVWDGPEDNEPLDLVDLDEQALGLAEPPRFELWFLSAGRICPA